MHGHGGVAEDLCIGRSYEALRMVHAGFRFDGLFSGSPAIYGQLRNVRFTDGAHDRRISEMRR